MSTTLRSRRSVLFLLPVLTLGLSGCWGSYSSLPSQKDIDVSGKYLGRLVGKDNGSASLDITLVEKDLDVTAVVKSRANAQTYILTGTRSVYTSSPVSINLTGTVGSGSGCQGGVTDTFSVAARLEYGYSSSTSGKVLGSGSVEHKTCVSGSLVRSETDSGQLELLKQ